MKLFAALGIAGAGLLFGLIWDLIGHRHSVR